MEQNQTEQKLMSITGAWGVGQSFLLHTVVKYLELSGEILQVTATSGSTAKLILGRTLHSFLGLDCEFNTSIKYGDQTWRSINSTDTLIVDEVSMIPAEILEKVDEIFRACAEGSSQGKPLCGKNVLLFGDLFQLLSVQIFVANVCTLHPQTELLTDR